MNSFELFLAQVNPLTIAREAFSGEAHRQMVRDHMAHIAALSATEPDIHALIAENAAFNLRNPRKRKPKPAYQPGGAKSLAFMELQRETEAQK